MMVFFLTWLGAVAPAPAFDSSRAWEHLRQLVAIGPRPAGSPEIEQAAEKIVASGANAVAIGSVYGSVAGLNNALRRMGAHPVLASVSFVGTTALLQRLKQDAVEPVISQVIGISPKQPKASIQKALRHSPACTNRASTGIKRSCPAVDPAVPMPVARPRWRPNR